MFIGRVGELEVLQEAYESRYAEMAIVYGRRRVGKTALLQHFCRDKNAFFYCAKDWKDEQQLTFFSNALSEQRGTKVTSFGDWISAIEFFCQSDREHKKILVLDEFQYIAQRRPEILSELQAAWDHSLSKENLLLILCGSAVSFIANEVLGEKNPLYGRARVIMKVRPLPFRDAAAFFPQFSAQDKFRAYATLGGIPYYCESLRQAETFESGIASAAIRSNGFLNREPESVLMQEFRDVASYNGILNAIAHGAVTFTEIAQRSLVESRVLPSYLSTLQSMDLVSKEFPVFAKRNVRGRASRGIYQIADNFLRFWFRYLAQQPDEAMTKQEALLHWKKLIEPSFSDFCSSAFEDVCRQYLLQHRFDEEFPLALTHFGRWWDRDVEIDVVGADESKTHVLVAECKYRNEKTTFKTLKSLDAKTEYLPVAANAQVHRWLFSKSGFDDQLLLLEKADPTLHLVTLEELLA